MNVWLSGDLGELDPRAHLDRLRECVAVAVDGGESLDAFFLAVASRDPVSCAELAVGPRASGAAVSVRAALGVAEALEEVVQPSGLYRRLVELAPELGGEVLAVAAARHPAAVWQLRLAQGLEPVAGAAALAATLGSPRFAPTCAALASAGLERALIALAAKGEIECVLALYRAKRREGCVKAAAALLDAHPSAPLVAWLAAVHGPELGELVRAVYAGLQTPGGRAALRLTAADFLDDGGAAVG